MFMPWHNNFVYKKYKLWKQPELEKNFMLISIYYTIYSIKKLKTTYVANTRCLIQLTSLSIKILFIRSWW